MAQLLKNHCCQKRTTRYGSQSRPTEKDFMTNSKAQIVKKDILGGASLTAALTFSLLSFSKSLAKEDPLLVFFSDAHISIYAGLLSSIFVFVLSILRFMVSLKLYDWKCNRKIKALKKLKESTSNPKLIKRIDQSIDKIVLEASNSAAQEQIKQNQHKQKYPCPTEMVQFNITGQSSDLN